VKQGVKAVVIACNTATSAAVKQLLSDGVLVHGEHKALEPADPTARPRTS